MLLYGEVDRDSRVRREAASLVGRGHRVTIATLTTQRRRPYDLDGARIIPLRPRRIGLIPGDDSPFRGRPPAGRLGRLAAKAEWTARYAGTFAYWTRAALHGLPPADVWHGHDLLGLLAAWSLRRAKGGALVHDSHELFMEAGSAARMPGPIRAAMRAAESRASRSADAVITVNRSIADELCARYGVDPVVVMNCPPQAAAPGEPLVRDALGLGDRRVVIHHGVLGPGRGLDHLVGSVALLPADVVVVLLGGGPLAAGLAHAAEEPPNRGRLFVLPPVPVEDVARWIAGADVGVIPFQAVDRNNVLATPNKLFEYLAAGVPVVVSDFPEMRRIVEETGAGVAVDTTSPASLAAGIQMLLGEPGAAREARRAAAREAHFRGYSWEAQAEGLLGVYDRLAITGQARA